MNRVDLITYIKGLQPNTDANLKFFNLMKSRLLEEDIMLEDVLNILPELSFDFSNINEDDDYLSEVATEYTAYCKLAYDKLKLHGLNDKRLYKRIFNRVYLKVER